MLLNRGAIDEQPALGIVLRSPCMPCELSSPRLRERLRRELPPRTLEALRRSQPWTWSRSRSPLRNWKVKRSFVTEPWQKHGCTLRPERRTAQHEGWNQCFTKGRCEEAPSVTETLVEPKASAEPRVSPGFSAALGGKFCHVSSCYTY